MNMLTNIFRRYKSIFNTFLILILIIPTFITVKDKNVSAVEETTNLFIKSPSMDSKINSTSVVISGTYTSSLAKADLVFSAEENGSPLTGEWTIEDTTTPKIWKFTPGSLSEGPHTLAIKINDEVPKTVNFTINSTLQIGDPTLLINSPNAGAEINTKHVSISGTFDADAPDDDLLFTAKENGIKISDSLVNTEDWDIDYTNKTWTFSTDDLKEGNHNITVDINNLPISKRAEASTGFSILLTRPYVTQAKIILAGGIEQKEGEDFTNVPLNAKLKVTVADDNPMTKLVDKIKIEKFNPIKILSGTKTIQGEPDITGPNKNENDGKYYYDITFDPNDSELSINKTYLVYIDAELMDDLDNPVFTKIFKFTTMTDVGWDDPNGSETQKHSSSNPHGHYQLNTNMCAACHSSHNSKSPSLTGGYYQLEFTEELTKDQPANDPSQNYCMACHDGTLNAPAIENASNYKHGGDTTGIGAVKQSESCTSCHNPHLEWSEENQNLLKDHFVYTHNEAVEGIGTSKVDSLDIACENCHDDNVAFDNATQKSVSIYDKTSFPNGEYSPLFYKKSLTATGNISDYSLCLRCHNDKNKADATDIETHYLKPENISGHFLVIPNGKIVQADGSQFNGPLPCAECHETHGSNNLFNLKKVLGTELQIRNEDKYETVGTTWDKLNEWNFCLNCHNLKTDINGKQVETEMYGKKASIDTTISGHEIATINRAGSFNQNQYQACSECHGGETQSFIEAAHAPTRK
jgi:hypothetical protein